MANNHSVRSCRRCLFFILLMFYVYLMSVPALDPQERCDPGPCRVGQFHNLTSNSCVSCPDGTFINQDNHSCQNCKPCRIADVYDEEVVLANCTTTQDTQLGCTNGYFTQSVTDQTELECLPCTECEEGEVLKRLCTMDSDTVCTDAKRNSSDMVQFNGEMAEVTTQRNLNGKSQFLTMTVPIVVVILLVITITIVLVVSMKRQRKKISTIRNKLSNINKGIDTSQACLTSNDEIEMQPPETEIDKVDNLYVMAEIENTSV